MRTDTILDHPQDQDVPERIFLEDLSTISKVTDTDIVSIESSIMTNTTSATQNTEDSTRGDSSTSSGSYGSSDSAIHWDGAKVYSVRQVYRDNVREKMNKDVITSIDSMIGQSVFPHMKFLTSWHLYKELKHDPEKDHPWIKMFLEHMNWGDDTGIDTYVQAIKWNTYSATVKSQFNSIKATKISGVKREVVSGKIFIPYNLGDLCYHYPNTMLFYYSVGNYAQRF